MRYGLRASPVATLSPGIFAMVMATGIIAVASSQQGIDWLAGALYVVAATMYAVLILMLLLRILLHRAAFVADVTSHVSGFAFLTTVAGTNVLAAASALIHGWWGLAWGLWWFALAVYPVFLYTTLIAVVIDEDKPGLEQGINGTWFLLTVATESIAVVAGLLLTRGDNALLAFTALAAFGLGLVLYLVVMTAEFLRWAFRRLDPDQIDPPAWIAAGAMAITVLAGSNLLIAAPGSPILARLAPFLAGVVILAWATATFWLPLMVALGVWRHLVRRVPLRYAPAFWALVFPIGMYSAATFRMLDAIRQEGLGWVPQVALAVALVAWAVTFGGLLHHVLQRPSETAA
ncbi:tellurite resistance/C4-dicarboxylate transporter family protein [Actinoplanes sp. NBC_00393]|uniref:tellurite resistance/C4-dicarboxylate transporter family protein n=1 Tax=Actinoplanes sp. NBC_00393 TaxID=2975953 RepID=UPI002E235CD1